LSAGILRRCHASGRWPGIRDIHQVPRRRALSNPVASCPSRARGYIVPFARVTRRALRELPPPVTASRRWPIDNRRAAFFGNPRRPKAPRPAALPAPPPALAAHARFATGYILQIVADMYKAFIFWLTFWAGEGNIDRRTIMSGGSACLYYLFCNDTPGGR